MVTSYQQFVSISITPSALPLPSAAAGSHPVSQEVQEGENAACGAGHPTWISTSWHVPLLTFKLGQGNAFSQIWEKAKSDGDIFARQGLSSSWKGKANKKVK